MDPVDVREGKTAPKLLHDILQYDPSRKNGAFNTLLDIPKFEDGKWVVDPTPPRNSCHHRWTLDEDHTILQSLNPELVRPPVYWVTTYCTKCRAQLSVVLNLQSSSSTSPCPSSGSPLHHFHHIGQTAKPVPVAPGSVQLDEVWELQEFVCTAATCAAKLQVIFRPSRLIPGWVKLLTDPDLVRARAERAIASDPERFEGHTIPTATDVLSNLRAYLLNGMQSTEPKVINGANKRWMLSLGQPCAEVLEYLGFTKKVLSVFNYRRPNAD